MKEFDFAKFSEKQNMSYKFYFRFSSRSSFNILDFDDEISLGLEKK